MNCFFSGKSKIMHTMYFPREGSVRSKLFGCNVICSLQKQTYFWLLLVSAKNNICKPEPGNDFCDIMTFVSPWPIRFRERIKLKCSSQRIPHAVVLGLLELNCDWLKIPTSQKSFHGSGLQMLLSAETSESQKYMYVCIRRLCDMMQYKQNGLTSMGEL